MAGPLENDGRHGFWMLVVVVGDGEITLEKRRGSISIGWIFNWRKICPEREGRPGDEKRDHYIIIRNSRGSFQVFCNAMFHAS